MGEKTINILNLWTNIFIALYFVILTAERIQSLVRAGSNKALLTDGLHNYMAGLCIVSFVGTIAILIARAASSNSHVQLILLSAAEGCILLSGMVHTEYTIPGIQFGAYGVLIVAMLLKVITQQDVLTTGRRVFILLYIVAFSMAIPVVYASEIKNKLAFHITESVVSFALVILFAVMFYALFAGQYSVITHPAFIAFALIGDALVLALRWSEKINWFVLVALAAAVVLWIVGIIINKPLLK